MCPTIIRTRNYRVIIYPKDHNPAHVHVLGPGVEAKFRLDDFECYYSRGFSTKAILWIQKYLRGKEELLWEAWNEYQE